MSMSGFMQFKKFPAPRPGARPICGDWPSSSPDLNVLDYNIWGILEARVNANAHRSLSSVGRAVKREWAKANFRCNAMHQIRAAVDSWRRRLQACVDANEGRFE